MFGIGEHSAGAGDNPVSVAEISGLFLVGAAIWRDPNVDQFAKRRYKECAADQRHNDADGHQLANGGPDTGLGSVRSRMGNSPCQARPKRHHRHVCDDRAKAVGGVRRRLRERC